MNALLARLKVVMSAAVTYLVAAGAIVAIVADEVSKNLPEGWQDNALKIGGTIVSVIAAAVAIIRRVTPVLPQDKGLLPPDRPANANVPPADDAANANVPPYPADGGAVNVGTLLMALAFVCFVVFTCIAAEWVTSDKGFVWLGGGLALWVAASFAP